MSQVLRVLTCVILGLLVLQASCQVGPYDCRRSHSGCASAADTCSTESGICVCANSSYSGYDCSLDLDLVAADPGTCDPPCEMGTCLKDNTCFCDPDRFGQRCEKDRVSVECFLDHMEITIQPNVGRENQFMGKVHVKGKNINSPDFDVNYCVSDVTAENDVMPLRYPDCGGAYNITTPEGDEKLTFQVLVLFRHPVIQASDLVYSVSCLLHQADKPFTFTSEISFPNKTDLDNKGSVDNTVNPIVLSIHDVESGDEITAVSIGQLIALEYVFDGGEKYCDFMLDRIVASDGNGELIDLLDAGCPIVDITQSAEQSSNTFKVIFKAFRFIFSEVVVIRSTAKVNTCNNPVQFPQPACDVDITGAVARRRRDVTRTGSDEAGVDLKELEATILVQFPQDSVDPSGPGQTAVTRQQGAGCTNSLVLLVLCVLLGCLLILTTGSCLFFFVRMRQHNGSDVTKKSFSKMEDMRSF